MAVSVRKLIVVAALFTLAVSPAAAGHPLSHHYWGRWIGYGWSEGYHARDEVPPRRPHSKRGQQWHSVMHGPTTMPATTLPPPPRNGVEVLPMPLPLPDAMIGPGALDGR